METLGGVLLSKKFLFIQLLIFFFKTEISLLQVGMAQENSGFTSNCSLHCPFDDCVDFIINFIFQSFIIVINTLHFKEFLWDIM